MKQLIMAVLAVSILTGLAFAQPRPDSCRIYIWDNDAGECAQEYPATSMERHLAHYTAWADMRDGNWNIYGQMTTFEGEPLTDNVRLNKFVDALNGAQKNPDISGVDANDHFAVVWQDSFEGGWRIRGRLFAPYFEPLSNSEFDCSYPSAYPKFRPRVAMNRASGMFVVVWAQYNSLTDSDVYAILLNPDGHPATDTVLVSEPSLRHQRRPSVCFSNAGIVVVWEDWRNGTFPGKPVIWAQKFDPDLHRDGVNYPISNIEYWAEYPDVSMDATENASDYYVVTWHSRQGGRNVRAARFDWSGMIDQEIQINPATLTRSYFPTVTTCVNGDFVVAWQDSFSYDAGVQTFVRYADRLGSLRNCLLVNDNEPRLQGYPSVASFGGRFSISWFDSLRLTGRGDIYGQNFVLNSDFDGDTIAKFGGNYRIDNIGPQGRKVWYHPKKNYDNPLTTDWDEDPIVEPDSIKIPLDSAFVLAFAERNNIPGQRFVRITNSDILAEGFYTQGKGSTDGYDVCVLDLGYATPALSAGEISRAQQDSLLKFADNGGAFLCSGNDFGEMYGSSRLFNCFGAQYLGPGHSTGNIDSMGGTHAMTDGMLFHYPYGRDEDNSVDYIVPDSSGLLQHF